MIKVSVLVITYNHARFIEKALESVLTQETDFDYEVVVGDDRSTDDTPSHINRFQRRYPGVIRQALRDNTIGATANAATTLAMCRGEYVAIIDGDDFWTSQTKLQK